MFPESSEVPEIPLKTRTETVLTNGRRPTFAKKRKEKKDVVFYTNFEEVLQKINAFGPYQIFCFIVILYASIEWAGWFEKWVSAESVTFYRKLNLHACAGIVWAGLELHTG